MNREKQKLISSRKGQSIIEAMVALSILMVGLMGVLALLTRSLLLERVTSDQAKATYLASEGIEIAKSFIDHDVYLGIATSYGEGGWRKCFPFSGSKDYDLDFETRSCPPAPNFGNEPLYLDPSSGLYYSSADPARVGRPTNFTRKIMITNPIANPYEIDVQSTVTWSTGPIINQQVTVEDHFYNWHP